MAEPKLPLKLRMDLRDNQARLDENIKAIADATGITFKLAVDFAKLAEQVKEINSDYVDRLGSIVYDSYLGALEYSIRSFVKKPLAKEQLARVLQAKATIGFAIVEKFSRDKYSNYNRTRVDDGVLVIEIPKDCFWVNVDDLGRDLEESLSTPSLDNGLSLKSRMNIQEYEPQRDEHLAALEASTGVKFVLEADFGKITAALPKDNYARERVGEMIYNEYLSGLASNIGRAVSDDMVKEALADMVSKSKVIAFEVYSKDSGSCPYHELKIEPNGTILIRVPSMNFPVNTSEVGQKILDLI